MTESKPLAFNSNGKKLQRVPGFSAPQEILIGYDELMPAIREILSDFSEDYTMDMESFECVRQAVQQYAIERFAQAQDQAEKENSDWVRHL